MKKHLYIFTILLSFLLPSCLTPPWTTNESGSNTVPNKEKVEKPNSTISNPLTEETPITNSQQLKHDAICRQQIRLKDTLSKIAYEHYGREDYYKVIFMSTKISFPEKKKKIIGNNPDLIFPDEWVLIPPEYIANQMMSFIEKNDLERAEKVYKTFLSIKENSEYSIVQLPVDIPDSLNYLPSDEDLNNYLICEKDT